MIAYFDTSAIVPLLLAEPTSDSCRDIWEGASKRVSSRLLYVEATAALEAAVRAGRISRPRSDDAFEKLEWLWQSIQVRELNEELMLDAAIWARHFGLRGYDSVHCAAAARLRQDGVVAASSDGRLTEAWSSLGLTVFNPSSDRHIRETIFRAERQAADQPTEETEDWDSATGDGID